VTQRRSDGRHRHPFASIDTEAVAVESWNRWYDVEHLPPNIALPGIMTGRRYVAPPELHDARLPERPMTGFADGQGCHITIYMLCGSPTQVMTDMTAERDVLEANGRMVGAGRREVRAGDCMEYAWGHGSSELLATFQDLPHVAHNAVRVVLRKGGDGLKVGANAVDVDGVHAVLGFSTTFMAPVECDIYLLEGDPAEVTTACRDAAPYGEDSSVLLDAPFQLITPFDYSFAERMRGSWLPQTLPAL
jgi:hypothetical protein